MLSWLKIVKEVLQMSGTLLSWNVIVPSVFITSTLLLLEYIPVIGIILKPMIETIREPLSWILLISVILFLYKLSYAGTSFVICRLNNAKKEHELKREINSKLSRLSPKERKILEYVRAGNDCGVWVSEKDAGVLTLRHKGLLEHIGDASIWEDWNGGREVCILVTIPEKVRNYVK